MGLDLHKYNPAMGRGKSWKGKPLEAGTERISTGYTPRKLQQLIHTNLMRFNVLVCHRRFGKTVLAINEMVDQGLRCKKHRPQYAYIAPTYKQAKLIAWEYILDFTKNIPFREVNKSELTVTIHRPEQKDLIGTVTKQRDFIKYMLLGADNPDSLRGLYLDGCILDEYAQCDPSIWGEVVRPALSDRKGWAIFIGTPKGQNHFFTRFKKAEKNPLWFTAVFKASETGVVDDEELADMRSDMDPEEYEQELECSFTAAIRGSFFGDIINTKRLDGSIGRFPWVPAIPVVTFWDLGMDDHTAIGFRQLVNGRWRYIDYYEDTGKGIEWYLKNIINKKPYIYARHVWPWDGNKRDLITGSTRKRLAEGLGLTPLSCQKRTSNENGMSSARVRLQDCDINETGNEIKGLGCDRLIECLTNYQREWDSKRMTFKETPLKDWSSHGYDMFKYSSLDDRKDVAGYSRDSLPTSANMDYNSLR